MRLLRIYFLFHYHPRRCYPYIFLSQSLFLWFLPLEILLWNAKTPVFWSLPLIPFWGKLQYAWIISQILSYNSSFSYFILPTFLTFFYQLLVVFFHSNHILSVICRRFSWIYPKKRLFTLVIFSPLVCWLRWLQYL